MKKNKMPEREQMPQQNRYGGHRVPGMEYTTALPWGTYSAAPKDLLPPGRKWEDGVFRYESTTRGKSAPGKDNG